MPGSLVPVTTLPLYGRASDGWGLLVEFLAWTLGAVVAHEATHYLAARALGRPAFVSWSTLNTFHGVPDGEPTVGDRLIGAAPWIVGLAVAAGLLTASVEVPLFGWFGLLLYTTGGGLRDLSVEVIDVRDQREEETDVSGTGPTEPGADAGRDGPDRPDADR